MNFAQKTICFNAFRVARSGPYKIDSVLLCGNQFLFLYTTSGVRIRIGKSNNRN